MNISNGDGDLTLSSEFFRKRAVFKSVIGAERQVAIPVNEVRVLDIEEGDQLQVFVAWPGIGTPIITSVEPFSINSGSIGDDSTSDALGFIMPEKDMPRKFPEIGAFIVAKESSDVDLTRRVYEPFSQFMMNAVIQKGTLSSRSPGGDTGVVNIRANQSEWLNIEVGDKFNVMFIDLQSDNLRGISRIPKYRKEVISGGPGRQTFTINTPIVRQRSFERGDIIQIVAVPTFLDLF